MPLPRVPSQSLPEPSLPPATERPELHQPSWHPGSWLQSREAGDARGVQTSLGQHPKQPPPLQPGVPRVPEGYGPMQPLHPGMGCSCCAGGAGLGAPGAWPLGRRGQETPQEGVEEVLGGFQAAAGL